MPRRRRTWPIALGVTLLLAALPACLFSFAWSWDVAVPAGHETHRLAIEGGRVVIEQDTVNTPPANTGLRFGTRFKPGFSFEYAQSYVAPSFHSKRIPFAMYLVAGAIVSVLYAFYRVKQPAGHCAECGYDLADSPDACPECGAPSQPRA